MKLISKTLNLLKPTLGKYYGSPSFSSVAAEALDPFQVEELKKKLIVVDENDKMIGTDTKYNCHLVVNGKIPLHRAFSVFIFNSKNEILLQQRASSKVTFPDHVTNACCSHPLYDTDVYRNNVQTMEACVSDRLSFELGIPRNEYDSANLKFITKIHYFSKGDGKWGEHEIDYLYVLHKDLTVVPNSMEVKQVWSIPKDKFDDFIRNCEYPLTPWFSEIKKEWLYRMWDNLDDLDSVRDDKIHKYVTE